AAVEAIDVVVAVDATPADLLERPALGQFRPVGVDAVLVLTRSDDNYRLSSSGRERTATPRQCAPKLSPGIPRARRCGAAAARGSCARPRNARHAPGRCRCGWDPRRHRPG